MNPTELHNLFDVLIEEIKGGEAKSLYKREIGFFFRFCGMSSYLGQTPAVAYETLKERDWVMFENPKLDIIQDAFAKRAYSTWRDNESTLHLEQRLLRKKKVEKVWESWDSRTKNLGNGDMTGEPLDNESLLEFQQLEPNQNNIEIVELFVLRSKPGYWVLSDDNERLSRVNFRIESDGFFYSVLEEYVIPEDVEVGLRTVLKFAYDLDESLILNFRYYGAGVDNPATVVGELDRNTGRVFLTKWEMPKDATHRRVDRRVSLFSLAREIITGFLQKGRTTGKVDDN